MSVRDVRKHQYCKRKRVIVGKEGNGMDVRVAIIAVVCYVQDSLSRYN